DVFVVAAGFVLRVLGGGVVIHVEISAWLIVCTTLLALFIALSKRRHELVLLGEDASDHRASLAEYSPYVPDQLISLVTASTVMSYALYTLSADVHLKFPGKRLELTVPFVLFGIFRYLYLVHQREGGGSPTRLLFTDRVLLSVVLLWAVSVILIIFLWSCRNRHPPAALAARRPHGVSVGFMPLAQSWPQTHATSSVPSVPLRC